MQVNRSVNIIKFIVFTVLATIAVSLLSACSTGGFGGTGFSVKNLAKGDIDFVADAHYRETQSLLKNLTKKLYRRNPSELSKVAGMTIARRREQLFSPVGRVRFAELDFAEGTRALSLALDSQFRGDRVLALMAGLNGMIRNAYEYRSESYMFDQLNEQKLYQSARNVEILVWQLSHLQDQTSTPLLITNSLGGEVDNLSFERLFGKLIALQDMMAVIVSQQNDRLIKTVTHNVASMVFFPL